jgi:hypothetical protein
VGRRGAWARRPGARSGVPLFQRALLAAEVDNAYVDVDQMCTGIRITVTGEPCQVLLALTRSRDAVRRVEFSFGVLD